MIVWKDDHVEQHLVDVLTDNTLGLKIKVEQSLHMGFHFLDLQVETERDEYITKVYWKPTYMPVLIPAWSHDPMPYKLAGFRSMFSRAYTRIIKWQDRRQEVAYIFAQGRKYCFTDKLMQGVWNKVSRYMQKAPEGTPQVQQDKDTCPFADITYYSTMDKVLKRALKDGRYRMARKRGPTIFNILRNEKDHILNSRKSGVYSIPLYSRDEGTTQYYIGSTKRNLDKMLKEHKADIKAGRMSTALAIKAYEHDVMIDWGRATILKSIYDGRGLTTIEAIELEKVARTHITINNSSHVVLPPSRKWCATNTL